VSIESGEYNSGGAPHLWIGTGKSGDTKRHGSPMYEAKAVGDSSRSKQVAEKWQQKCWVVDVSIVCYRFSLQQFI